MERHQLYDMAGNLYRRLITRIRFMRTMRRT